MPYISTSVLSLTPIFHRPPDTEELRVLIGDVGSTTVLKCLDMERSAQELAAVFGA